MFASRTLLVVGFSVALAACGGGGGTWGPEEEVSEEVLTGIVYPPKGPLGKYVGRYSVCRDHREFVLDFSATKGNDLTFYSFEVIYANPDCSGNVLGTFGWDAPADMTYISTDIATVSGEGLPASLSVDKGQVSVSDIRGRLYGVGVSGNCVTYPTGSLCYDVTTPQTSTTQGGMYLAGNKLYELRLNNGVYSVDNVYAKH